MTPRIQALIEGRPAAVSAPAISLGEVAKRAGLTRPQLEEIFRRSKLEPMLTLAEVGEHLRLKSTAVFELVRLGRVHGQRLHPVKGGLWPTYKPSHKTRLVPMGAIERHLRHMGRVHDGAGVVVDQEVSG